MPLLTTLFILVLALCNVAEALPVIHRDSLAKQSQTIQQETAYDAGIKALSEERWQEAIQIFENEVESRPDVVNNWLGLAEAWFGTGKLENAGDVLTRGRKLHPKNPLILSSLGRYHYVKREYSQSEALFLQALEHDPENAKIHRDLADLYLNAFNSPTKAIPHYLAATRTEPNHAGSYYALGIAYLKSGDLAKAEQVLRKSISLQKPNPLATLQLARLYRSTAKLEEAQALLESLLEEAPNSLPIQMELAEILQDRGQNKRAETLYLGILRDAPEATQAYMMLALLKHQEKNWSDAEKYYVKVTQLSPDHALAYNNLAWVVVESGRQADILGRSPVALAEKAVSLEPDNPDYLDTLATLYYRVGRKSESVQTLERAINHAPRRPDLKMRLADIYKKVGLPEKANKVLEEVRYDFPDFISTREHAKAKN